MSSTSQAMASDVLAQIPSSSRRARSREFLYAIIAAAVFFALVTAAAVAGMRSAPLAGEEGADALAAQALVTD